MNHRLQIYLDQVMAYARLSGEESFGVRNELADHLQTRIDHLQDEGATYDDAVFRAIHDHGSPMDVGYGLRAAFPWLDVRLSGTAHGVIAVGPRAVGVVSCGFISTGVVSCGIFSVGAFSFGLLSVAMLMGMGVISVASLAIGAIGIGVLATGLNAIGIIAAGKYAIGVWVASGGESLSVFNESNVPTWMHDLGGAIIWSKHDLFFGSIPIGLLPSLLLAISLAAIAVCLVTIERRRVATLQSWLFH